MQNDKALICLMAGRLMSFRQRQFAYNVNSSNDGLPTMSVRLMVGSSTISTGLLLTKSRLIDSTNRHICSSNGRLAYYQHRVIAHLITID